MKKFVLMLVVATVCCFAVPQDISAEVRLGKNVRIGGHDASNQIFDRKRRGKYHIYKGKPAKPGCTWKRNSDGSKTKTCHLQRKNRR